MVTVGSRELKNRMGKYLAMVRQGQAIRITDRGKAIACILPGVEPEGHPSNEVLARLLATGTIRLARRPLRRHAKPARMTRGKSVAEMVSEDRR